MLARLQFEPICFLVAMAKASPGARCRYAPPQVPHSQLQYQERTRPPLARNATVANANPHNSAAR